MYEESEEGHPMGCVCRVIRRCLRVVLAFPSHLLWYGGQSYAMEASEVVRQLENDRLGDGWSGRDVARKKSKIR